MRHPDLIVIHSAATPNGREFHADDIRRWHTDPKPQGRGWRVPGYHFVVTVDGDVETLVLLDDDGYLEPWEIANGVKGYNGRSIHICMIGTNHFSIHQWEELKKLVLSLNQQFPSANVIGHRDLNPHKECPGFDVSQWLAAGHVPLPEHILDVEI